VGYFHVGQELGDLGKGSNGGAKYDVSARRRNSGTFKNVGVVGNGVGAIYYLSRKAGGKSGERYKQMG